MLKPSDFNNAVPQFQNGNYASNPINPQYVEEPSSTDYNHGTEPLQTLPAQWWNWFINKFTSRFNKVNIYVKNLFNELAQLLSLVNVTPDGTESSVTDGQLKNAFKELYPDYINTKLALESTYVKKTQKVNNHALTGDVTVTKSDVGLGNVPNVTTNNQTPTYTVASSLTNLTSGEVLSTAFGKIAKAVSSIISHIANVSNPHSVTKAQVGLGSVVNTSDSAIPIENGTTKFTTGGAYTLKKDLTDIAESLPTDAVLHYSFDEVPDYPDGTATLRKLNDFTTTAGFDTMGQGVLSVANGELINTVTNGTTAWIRRPRTIPSGIIKLKIRANKNLDIRLSYYDNDQSNYVMIERLATAKANQSYYITSFIPKTTSVVLIWGYTRQATDFQLTLSEIYIGDGSYSTPIIDNANGENNATNNGGIAAQGVSGKGVKCFNGNYVSIPNFSLNKNFSVALWVKPENITSNLRGELFRGAGQLIIRNGENGLNKFCVYLWQSSYPTEFQISDLLPSSEWIHIVVIKNGSVLQVYKNGIRSNNFTLPNDNLQEPTENNYTIANSSNTRPQSFDDLLVFNRALSTTEVMALYQNKANTPKYYGEVPVTRKINGYTLEEDVTLTKTDFGLENVVNTGDSATPVSSGTTKFTTGGAYNLLTSLAPIFSASTSYAVGDMVTYNGRLYTCTTAHSGAWNASHFTVNDFNSFYNFTGGIKDANVWTERIFKDRLCKNWTLGTGFTLFNQPINSICYGNNLWVASTGDKKLIWSKDGKAWTEGAVLQEYMYKIIYANNLWVAVGNNLTAWSNNGKSWTTTAQAGRIKDVLYANNLWVATSLGSFWWSENGKDWVEGSHYSNLGYENSLGYKDGVWVAFEKDIYNSTDGKTWQKLTSDDSVTVGCYGNGEWLAINGNKVYKSKDGINWDSSTTGAESISRLIYGNGVYIRSDTSSASYSIDGNHWYSLQGNYDGVINTQAVCYNNGLWVASAGSGSVNIVSVSYDGILWFSLSLHNNNTYAKRGRTVYYANGMWLIGTFDNAIYWSSFENAI